MANTSIELRLPKFRLSYPNLVEPQTYKDGSTSYTMSMIIEPDTDIDYIMEAIEEAIVSKWGERRPAKIRLPIQRVKSIKDDPVSGFDLDQHPYYEGKILAKGSSRNKPGLADALTGSIITSADDLYPGCFCVASVSVFAHDKHGPATVSFGINNVVKVADGEPISARRKNVMDDFADLMGTAPAETSAVKKTTLSL